MDFIAVGYLNALPLLFCVGFIGGLIAGVTGFIGGVLGGGKSKKAFKSQESAFARIKREDDQTILNLKAQLAQKKKTNLIPIFVIGGVGLTGVLLLKR